MVLVREWRERQEEEIRHRDEASAAKKQKTIKDAEKAIDDFYKEYNQKAERNIKQNKFRCFITLITWRLTRRDITPQGKRSRIPSRT